MIYLNGIDPNTVSSFTQILNAVYTLTNRPDLEAETIKAILSATLELHAADNWWPDRTEIIIPASQITARNAKIDRNTYFPRVRRIELLRPVDLSVDPTGLDALYAPLEQLEPNAIFNEFYRQKDNYFYLTSTSVVVRTSFAGLALFCTYFPYPVANSTTNYSSWIATEYPFAIINRATRKVFLMIGWDEAASRLERVELPADLQYLRQNYISNV